MRVLLDTHAFLWWISDSPRLSRRAREIMDDGSNELFLSAASVWEIAIKARLGSLQVPGDLERFIPEQLLVNAIQGLPVSMSHALRLYGLPPHHRDPFDRMLVAQSQVESLAILTADAQIGLYDVQVIW